MTKVRRLQKREFELLVDVQHLERNSLTLEAIDRKRIETNARILEADKKLADAHHMMEASRVLYDSQKGNYH